MANMMLSESTLVVIRAPAIRDLKAVIHTFTERRSRRNSRIDTGENSHRKRGRRMIMGRPSRDRLTAHLKAR